MIYKRKAIRLLYKNTLLLIIVLVVSGTSCTKTASTEKASDSSLVDSVTISVDSNSNSFPPVSVYALQDSIWKKTSSRILKMKDVKNQFYPVKENKESDLTFYVHKYLELDSIKRGLKNKRQEDGQVISVKIKFLDTLYANMNYTLCSWLLEYQTAEQCPYASGTIAAISTFDSNTGLISSAMVAENSGGADAPISWARKRAARIQSDGKIFIQGMEENTDEGQTEVITYEQEGQISSDGIITLKEKKEILKKTNKPEN